VDRTGQENDPFLEQAGLNIKSPLATVRLLDHHRDQGIHVGIHIDLC